MRFDWTVRGLFRLTISLWGMNFFCRTREIGAELCVWNRDRRGPWEVAFLPEAGGFLRVTPEAIEKYGAARAIYRAVAV